MRQIHEIHKGLFYRTAILFCIVSLNNLHVPVIVIHPVGIDSHHPGDPFLNQVIQVFQQQVFPLHPGKLSCKQVKVDLADVELFRFYNPLSFGTVNFYVFTDD